MSNSSRARHRAIRARHGAPHVPARPVQTAGLGRGLTALASSGLLVVVAASSATAVEPATDTRPAEVRAGELVVTAEARAALVLSPVVVVPADAPWETSPITVTSEPAPPPEPEPVVVARTARTSTRVAAAATPQPAAAPAPAPAVQAAPPQAASGSAVVDFARQFIGVPYVYGGTTPAGFDCSGFTQYVYAHFGVSLPRTSSAQGTVGVRISASEAQPGDLLWWPGHVGIYTGNGNHIAARNPGKPLTESPIYDWSVTYIRVL